MRIDLDRARITAAVKAAERRTSAEIVVAVSPFFVGRIAHAARRAFDRIGVAATRRRNGVLVFVVPARRQVFVLPDVGAEAGIAPTAWGRAASRIAGGFARGLATDALVDAIDDLATALAPAFPPAPDDTDELGDEVRDLPADPTRPFRWSWRLGAPFGIGVFLHATFLLLIALVLIGELVAGHGLAAALESVGFLAVVFVVIVLHELGHAMTALRFGVRTRAITLLPIGGVASLDRMPEKPSQELLVALAGPAVNVALAGLLALAMLGTGASFDVHALTAITGHFVTRLFWVNVSLAVFNLVPAFPMDGGRVLRALLAMRVGIARATETAARVGKIVAVGFALIGVLINPMLILIALFVWLGADSEVKATRVRAALAGVCAGDAMITAVVTLTPGQPLGHAAALIVKGYAHDFPVFENGRLLGLLTHADVLRGLAAGGPDAPVSAAMHRQVASVSSNAPLARALGRLQSGDAGVLVVTGDGGEIGMLSLAGLAEFLAMKRAAARSAGHRPRA